MGTPGVITGGMGILWGHLGDVGTLGGSESYGDMGASWGHRGDMGTLGGCESLGDILGS